MKAYFIALLMLVCSFFIYSQDTAVRLGTDSGEGMLVDPRQIEEGPDGNIYVMDGHDSFIKVYSSEGKYLHQLGGKGEGPGMIKRAGGFTFTPDRKSLVFCEFFGGHRWLTLIHLPDRFSRVIPLEIKGDYGALRMRSLKDGTYLIWISEFYVPVKKREFNFLKTPHALVRVTAGGKFLGEIHREEIIDRMSFLERGADVAVPFTPFFHWAPWGKDKTIVCDGVQNHAEIFDFNGKKTGAINLEIPPPRKVTSRDLNEWRREYKELLDNDPVWYQRFGSVIEKYTESIYKDLPVFSGFEVTPEGNLLLSGEGEGEKRRYWLLSKQGKLLFQFQSDLQAVKLSKNVIFYLLSDEEDESEWFFKARSKGDIESLKDLASAFK